MPRLSPITSMPPQAVREALAELGRNIRTARLRRRWSRAELAEKVGTTRQVIGLVEAGKASTAVAVYAGALWALGLLDELRVVGHPDRDEEGKALENLRRPRTAPKRRTFDDDF